MPAETPAQERARMRMRKPEPSFYLEQRKLEYKTFAKEYVQPVVESGLVVYEKERAKEEAKIEETWKAEVTSAEEAAALAFEESLETAKATIEPEIPEEQISAWERQERKRFQESLSEWRSEQTAAYQEYIQQWRSEWRPAGLAERMLAWRVPTTPGDWLMGLRTPTKAPLAPVAGMVASVESFVYGLAGLAGVKAPRPTPTVVGSIVSQYIFGKPEEMRALQEYPRGYAGGTLIGDFILGLALGKGVEKVVIKPLSPYVSRAWRAVQRKVGLIRSPSPIITEQIPSFMSKEEWYEFYVQTARATTRPVRVRPEYVTVPWRVTTGEAITPMSKTLMKVVKYPATPIGGGVTILQQVTEQVPVRYPFSLKTAIAPYLMATAPKATYPITIGLPLVYAAKAVPKAKVAEITKPSLLTTTILTPKISDIPVIGVQETVVPAVKEREEQIVSPIVSQVAVQESQLSQISAQILNPHPSFQRLLPVVKKPRPEVKKKKKKKRPKRKPLKWERYHIIYPVTGVSEVAKHILS